MSRRPFLLPKKIPCAIFGTGTQFNTLKTALKCNEEVSQRSHSPVTLLYSFMERASEVVSASEVVCATFDSWHRQMVNSLLCDRPNYIFIMDGFMEFYLHFKKTNFLGSLKTCDKLYIKLSNLYTYGNTKSYFQVHCELHRRGCVFSMVEDGP